MPPTRVRPPLRRVARDDSGFTVIEALVSFVILVVVSAAALTAIVNATQTSKSSTDRVTAANIAQGDLQSARSLRFPNYPQARSGTAIVQGTTYTVARTVSVKTSDGMTAGATCPATPSFTASPYMMVTTTVTWPGGTTNKVVVSTQVAC